MVCKNVGVLFDSALKCDEQINVVVKSSFYQLRALAKVNNFLSFKHFETEIHACIPSRIDYCNPLFFEINNSFPFKLQMVQNMAALHWLLVRFTINFKVILLVFKWPCPSYLSDLFCEHHPVRTYRSANQSLIV